MFDTIFMGFVGSLLAGAATGIGSMILLVKSDFSEFELDIMLGVSAGIMMSASFFSLLLPSIEKGSIYWASAGFVSGALFMFVADRFVPHEHFVGGQEGYASRITRFWLIILAITIHNFPEGMSVGVAFAGENLQYAIPLAIGIGLQNIPEGLSVSFPLLKLGYDKKKSIIYGFASGLVEPIGGIISAALVTLFHFLLPVMMAFAAGAMIYVIGAEMIPESHSTGRGKDVTLGLIAGFVLMMLLDVIL